MKDIIAIFLTINLITQRVQSLKVLTGNDKHARKRSMTGEEIFHALYQPHGLHIKYKNRRNLSPSEVDKVRDLLTKLKKQIGSSELKSALRQNASVNGLSADDKDLSDVPNVEHEKLVETELVSTLRQESELYKQPYVEQKGNVDFLVMKPELLDPHVTVVPNSMYYDIHKKCVNWLDDCSLRGIRARLLRGVRWQYK